MQRARARTFFILCIPTAQPHTTPHVRRNPIQPSTFIPTAPAIYITHFIYRHVCGCARGAVLFFVLGMQYFDPVPFCFVSVFILSTYNSKLINFKNRAIHITDPKPKTPNQNQKPQTKTKNPLIIKLLYVILRE